MLPQLVLLCIALPPLGVFAIKQMAGDQLEQRLDENFLCTNVILTLCGYVPGRCMGGARPTGPPRPLAWREGGTHYRFKLQQRASISQRLMP